MNFFRASSGPAYVQPVRRVSGVDDRAIGEWRKVNGTAPAAYLGRTLIKSYEQRVQDWSSPPVDDIGYLPARDLLAMDPHDLHSMIVTMAHHRYQGWRNYQGRWRDVLGLDSTYDKNVLDFGCGVGLEALQYALTANDITVADISRDNIQVAVRVLRLWGFAPDAYHIRPEMLVPSIYPSFDVIHCCGVLHHIPHPEPVMRAFHAALSDDGEVRLMLYSDQAWRIATETEPPRGYVEDHPLFETYWQHWDPIGGYADWYDENRLLQRFGHLFDIVRYEPLTEHGEYLGVVMSKI